MNTMELNVRCVLLLTLGLCSTLLMTTVAAHQEEEEPIMEMAGDVEDELEDLGLGEELLDGEVEPEEADTPTGPPPAPKVIYKAPEPMGEHFFAESFDRGTLDSWVLSKAKKEDIDEDIAKYDGKWEVEDMKDSKLPGDKGLVLKSRAKHHAISAQLLRPFIFDTKPLIVQYEDEFVDKTPYTIMFGPDKCGEDYKLHFIFRHKNPKTGEYEEKHAKKPDADLRTYYTDKKTHLYTLVLNPDNSFEVLVDQTVVNSGNLLTDVTPPINPAAEIEDPDDHKPEDWDERPKIQDPDAVKPEDWDEDAPKQIPDEDAVKPDGWLDDQPEYTSDPDAVKPEDWDEDMDGEWEAPQVPNALCETAPGCGAWQRPMIDNPNYKGKWKAPMIDNPNYQGVWKPRKIANPDFFEDLHPFRMTPFIAPGLVNQMMTAADERPWLWVVYVLTVAVPFVLLIVFFCTGKFGQVWTLVSKTFSKCVAAAAEKKSDAEDSPAEKEDEEEEEEEEEAAVNEEGEEEDDEAADQINYKVGDRGT
ncbi:unnamed protein product [Coregonus sp. 'balchen']|nr:unnamed protein product [Coregonus sp. 'balchen']